MDGNSKEEFCTMCSVEVPSAFMIDNEYNEEEKKENKESKLKNVCIKWTMNILFWVIIIAFLYFLFRKS